jgi:hypothetical protein
VDGDRVGGASDAFYETIEVDLGGLVQFNWLIIMITDFGEGCDVFEEIFETVESNCDDLCDEYVDIAEAFKLQSRDYWTFTMIAVNDNDDFEGEFDYDDEPFEEEFTATFSTFDVAPLLDHGDCEDECEDLDLLESDDELGDRGDLEITHWDEGDTITGRYEVEFGGDEGVKGGFKAEHCNMKDWLWFF